MGSERRTINFQYAKQLENQQAQNAWQAEQNDIDRNWQASEWERQFRIQMDEQMQQWREQLGLQNEADFQKWKKQFDLENQFNDPSSQIARLMAAGINPAAAASQFLNAGDTSAAIGGSSSPSGSGAASGGSIGSHSVSPSLISNPNFSTDAALFSSVAQLGDSLGKMVNNGVGAYATAKKIEPEISKTLAETDAKREETALTRINRLITEQFGSSRASVELQKAVTQSYVLYTEGKYNEARTLLTGAQEKLTEEQTGQIKEQRPELLTNLRLLGEIYKSEKQVNFEQAMNLRSEQALHYAQADMYNQLSQTEKALREGRVTKQDLENGIAAIDYGLRMNAFERDNKTQQSQIYAILEQCKREGYISEQQLMTAKTAIKDNNWYEFNKIVGTLQGFQPLWTPIISGK